MDIDIARTGDVRLQEAGDLRTRLSRDKFFVQRPKPLERWLWRQRLPSAAERVFWFHWAEGARNGDWCSQFAVHFVARHCEIDSSTVTRAYQALKRLGLIRRTDPGRDAANPFEQATAITEVLLPPEFLKDMQMAPNRPSRSAPSIKPAPPPATPPVAAPSPPHPHQHLDLAQRRVRLKELGKTLSPTEFDRWNKAICGTARTLQFDSGTHVPTTIQAEILAYLASREAPKPMVAALSSPLHIAPNRPRRVSVFDTARLRHGLQQIGPIDRTDELTRQVLWSIEAGSLQQFGVMHAINIALKKIRVGQWSRPHRMPPNWLRKLSEGAAPETCSRA